MKTLSLFVYAIAYLATLVAGASIPRYSERAPITRANLDSNQVQRELGRQLSPTTVIFGPKDTRFNDATARWNTFAVPHPQVIIEPGQESDVSIIASVIGATALQE
ncbi:hypothetical protein NX059_011731 [Plenodomus lindquistii]|nr:hypothetical protein NX059_011731 [Plenodomus lindquistii]